MGTSSAACSTKKAVDMMLAHVALKSNLVAVDNTVDIGRGKTSTDDRAHQPLIKFKELQPLLRSPEVAEHHIHA